MKSSDVIGRTITRVLRTQFEYGEDLSAYCTYYFELDGVILLEIGYHREHDPLRLLSLNVRNRMDLVEVQDGTERFLVGRRIEKVQFLSETKDIYIGLSGGMYVNLDEFTPSGSVLGVTDEDSFFANGVYAPEDFSPYCEDEDG